MAANRKFQSVSAVLLLTALCGALLGGGIGAFFGGVFVFVFALCGAMAACAVVVAWLLIRDG